MKIVVGEKVDVVAQKHSSRRLSMYAVAFLLALPVLCGVLSVDTSSFDPTAQKPFMVCVPILALLFIILWRYPSKTPVTTFDGALFVTWLVSLFAEMLWPPAAFGPVYPLTLLLWCCYLVFRKVFFELSCIDDGVLWGNDIPPPPLLGWVVYGTGLCIVLVNALLWLFPVWKRYGAFSTDSGSHLYESSAFAGTFGNPNYLASVLLLFLPGLFWVLVVACRKRMNTGKHLLAVIVHGFFFFATAGLLYVTQCRSALIIGSFSVLAFWYRIRRTKKTTVFAFTAAAILLFLAAGGISSSTKTSLITAGEKRMVHWEIAWDDISKSPLRGWGPGGFERVYCQHRLRPKDSDPSAVYVHNMFLQLAGACGVQILFPVFVIFFALLFGLHQEGASPQSATKVALEDNQAFALNAGLLAFLVDNMVNVTVFVFSPALVFFFVAAAWVSLHQVRNVGVIVLGRFPWVLLSGVIALTIPFSLALWDLDGDFREMRAKKTSTDGVLRIGSSVTPQIRWFRHLYDEGSCQAVNNKFSKSLTSYAITSGHIPCYQSSETNMAIVRKVLSQKKFKRSPD